MFRAAIEAEILFAAHIMQVRFLGAVIKPVHPCTGLITAPKNRMTLQSSTDGNIQKCTSVYIFELRVFHWKNSSLLNTPDILSAITSLTFRQTRVQALYMDVQRLIEDFCFNRCPKHYRPSFCLFLTYSRNLFCEKRMLFFIC